MTDTTAATLDPVDAPEDEAPPSPAELAAIAIEARLAARAAERAARLEAAVEADCAPCIHACEHGWWGDMGRAKSHCRKCHHSWASLREMHCVTCCAHFTNPDSCDAHLTEDGCRPPESIMRRDGRPKFTTIDRGNGPVYKLAFYGVRPQFGHKADEEEELDAA